MADSTKYGGILDAHRATIGAGWEFSRVASETEPDVGEEWSSCKVPTSVQVELIRQGKIADPYKGLNEWDCQCELMLRRWGREGVTAPRNGEVVVGA